VGFYEVSAEKRQRVGPSPLPYRDAATNGYRLGRWYHLKLAVERGRWFRAKVWPLGGPEPDWMYSATLDEAKLGPPVPLLTASRGTNGEAAFDYFLVTNER
jgi:hypothetical protein